MTVDQFNYWWEIGAYTGVVLATWYCGRCLKKCAYKEVPEADKAAVGLALLFMLIVYLACLAYLLYNAKHVLQLIFVA